MLEVVSKTRSREYSEKKKMYAQLGAGTTSSMRLAVVEKNAYKYTDWEEESMF